MGWVLAVDFGTVVTAAAVVDVGVGGGGRPVAVDPVAGDAIKWMRSDVKQTGAVDTGLWESQLQPV